MGLLPDIVDGKIIESAEDKYFKKFSNNLISKDKKKKLHEALGQIKKKRFKDKAKKMEESVDESLSELNNMGHNEVTEDFEDSPFADREELDLNDEE